MGGEHTSRRYRPMPPPSAGVMRELSLKLGRRLRESGRLVGRLSLKIHICGFRNPHSSVPSARPWIRGCIAELALEASAGQQWILTGDEAATRPPGWRAGPSWLAPRTGCDRRSSNPSSTARRAGLGTGERRRGEPQGLNSRSSKLAPEGYRGGAREGRSLVRG